MVDCRSKALELIGRRPHFRLELEHKLTTRGFDRDEIEVTLAELDERGWIDDPGNAQDLVQGALTRKGFGPRRMLFELHKRGVEPELAEEVVREVFSEPGAELERARQVASRAASGRAGEPDRLARFLDRKGFSRAVIVQILQESEP